MTANSIPQNDALRLQLAMIAGNEPPTSRVEMRYRTGRGAMSRQFFGVREVDRTVSAIRNMQRRGDTFVGVAPRVRDSGKAADVESVWCLWADLDDAETLARLAAFNPLPSIVIRTGSGGGHAYWQLREPLPGPWAQRANRRLGKALGGDLAATDPARVLRPAGSVSYKHEPPRPVVCTRIELDVFTVDQIVSGLDDDRKYRQPRPPVPASQEPRGGSLDALVRVVQDAQRGERNRCLFWSACRAGEHVRAGTFDAAHATTALREAALAIGLGEIEIDRTIRSGLESEAA